MLAKPHYRPHKMSDLNDLFGMSDEMLTEQAYLIQRGVRPLVLLSPFPTEHFLMQKVVTRLGTVSHGLAIPFVIDRGDGTAECGFAMNRWVVETLDWVFKEVSPPHSHRIVGLLLGYSAPAIENFEQRQSICWPTVLGE